MSLHEGDGGKEALAASEVVLEAGNAKATYCTATSTAGDKSDLNILKDALQCCLGSWKVYFIYTYSMTVSAWHRIAEHFDRHEKSQLFSKRNNENHKQPSESVSAARALKSSC
jgi:hypothetical protein